MNKHVYILLLIFIIGFSLQTPIINSSQNNITPLYEAKHKTIPDTLPWYPIVVFGDNRPENTSDQKLPSIFYKIIEEFDTIQPIAVIGTGDHVGMGYEYQYEELYRVFNETNLENIWMAIGNHDIDVAEGRSNWAKYIGPEYYYVDDIPGWRIAVVDSETNLWANWKNQLLAMYENLSNRSLIFVFHRPAFPDVDHNLASDRINTLLNVFKSNGYPKIVLQGHWHGWAYEIKYNVTWIITGGGGAPLYTYGVPAPENGEVVVGKYHYLVLILYPNQTFQFYPVLMGVGSISVDKVNETTYIITNNKLDIHGNPVAMPVRIKHVVSGVEMDTVLMAPPKSKVYVTYLINGNTVKVLCNASKWYVYLYDLENPDASPVYTPVNDQVVFTAEIPVETETTTPTTTPETISIETNTTTPQTTSKTTTTSTPSKTTTTSTTIKAEEGVDPYVLAITAIALILVVGTITWYYMFRR